MNKIVKLLLISFPIFVIGCTTPMEQITIGVVANLTGSGAVASEYCISGLELAVNELNTANNDVKYELIYEDSQSNPSLASNCFKMLEMKGAKYIIALGGQFSLVVAPMTNGKEMLYFTTGDYNEAVLTMTDCGFRVFPSATTFGEVSARFLLDSLKVSKIATISMNTVPCLMATNSFEKWIKHHDGEIVFQDKYDIGTNDFRNTISKLASTDVEAVFFNGFGNSPAAFCNQLAQYPQLDNLIIMGDVNFSIKSFTENNNNDKLRIFYADAEMEGVSAQDYSKMNKIRPNTYVYCGYMLPYLIHEAISETSDKNDYRAQRAVLLGRTIKTSAGSITFDSIGNADMDMKVFKLE